MHVSFVKGHGSSNDILVIPHAVSDVFPSLSEAQSAARLLCDRAGPLGADGVYFAELDGERLDAIFLNPDGSVAEVCGNGMRLLARLAFDRGVADPATFAVGKHRYVASKRPDFGPGVRSVSLRMPPVLFAEADGSSGAADALSTAIPRLGGEHRFRALRVPNPHLVAVVGQYDEADLVRVGERANSSEGVPGGANVSFILPLPDGELFVRTFERGAGLTPSCGSGNAASLCVAVREGLLAEGEPTLVRNVGGPLRGQVSSTAQGRLVPEVEGNATIVLRGRIDLDGLRAAPAGELTVGDLDRGDDETLAFARLLAEHRQVLARRGLADAGQPAASARGAG